MNSPPEIYEFIAQRRQPRSLSGAWEGFSCSEDFSVAVKDEATLLQALTAKFTNENLRNAGVIVPGTAGDMVLRSGLASSDRVTFALRTSEKDPPFDLCVDGGCLSGQQLPVCAILRDFRCAQLLQNSYGQILLVFSVEDAMALWAIGFPAVTCSGIECFSRETLKEFRKVYGSGAYRTALPHQGESGELPENYYLAEPPQLVLANWSPARLELADPPALDRVRQHLIELHHHLGIDLGQIEVWKPSDQQVKRLRCCLSIGSLVDVRNALVDSLDNQRESLIEQPKSRPKPPPTYATAAAEWTEALFEDRSISGFEEGAWKKLLQIHEQDVIAPLLKLAQAMNDPIRRTLVVAAATLSRVVHTQSLLLTANYRKQVQRNASPSETLGLPKELKNVIATTDRLLEVIGKLQPCPPQTAPRRSAKVLRPRRGASHSNNSSSPMRNGSA